jgi:hypothetical protein
VAVAPAMSSASVTINPSNPSSSRSSPVRILCDIVAGTPGSMAGITTCAVMIVSTPAAMSALNGGRSIWWICWSVCVTSGRPKWLSTPVSPWPGKCLATAETPPSWNPFTCAAASVDTRPGSPPIDRIPITGLFGLMFTSETGA